MSNKPLTKRLRSETVFNISAALVRGMQIPYFALLAARRLSDEAEVFTRGTQVGLLACFTVGLLGMGANQWANEKRIKESRPNDPRVWLGYACYSMLFAANCLDVAGLYADKDHELLANFANIIFAIGYSFLAALELNAFRGTPAAQLVGDAVAISSSRAGSRRGSGSEALLAQEGGGGAAPTSPALSVAPAHANMHWMSDSKVERGLNVAVALGCVFAVITRLLISMEGPKIPGVKPHFSPDIATTFAIMAAASFVAPTADKVMTLARTFNCC